LDQGVKPRFRDAEGALSGRTGPAAERDGAADAGTWGFDLMTGVLGRPRHRLGTEEDVHAYFGNFSLSATVQR
jgi:hypothetical protein